MIVFFEGPDGCGKTEVSTEFARANGFPRFKVPNEREMWERKGHASFAASLPFDFLLTHFIEQVGLKDVVFDRGYASEWVYSKEFGRETNDELLQKIDDRFAQLGAVHVILKRHDYSGARQDELVRKADLNRLSRCYSEFAQWSRCSVLTMFVDAYDEAARDRSEEEFCRRQMIILRDALKLLSGGPKGLISLEAT